MLSPIIQNLNYALLYPELLLCGTALLVLMTDLFIGENQKTLLGWLSIAGLAMTLFVLFNNTPLNNSSFYRTFSTDMFSVFFKSASLVGTLLIIFASMDFLKSFKSHHGEFYCLVLLSTAAILFLSSAQDLILLYLSLEFLSICSYILAAFLRRDPKSSEAGIKYFLLGSVTSAVMLYGISFIYGLTGSTQLTDIANAVSANGLSHSRLLFFASMLLLTGFGFKSALFPFHMWCPDTYEGAPTAVTAYLACVAKLGGLVGILRIFWTALLPMQTDWSVMLAVLSAFSMTIGNLAALPQTNIKRLLAYSSISHAGFILMGFASATEHNAGIQSVLVYILSYIFMNMGAFIVVMIVSSRIHSETIEDYAGLAQRSPFLAFCLAIFMLSLLGLPPLAGFVAKFYVLSSAVSSGMIWLAIVALVNSVISAYYYLNVVRVMYVLPPKETTSMETVTELNVALFISMAFTVIIMFVPVLFSEFTRRCAEMLRL